MLASYTIRKSVNVPDVIGLNVNDKVKMIDCVTTQNAYLGDIVAKYTAELKERYCIRINIIATKENEYEISVLKSSNMDDLSDYSYDDYDDEDDDDYYGINDCSEEIFCETASADKVVEVLGDACAYIEKSVKACHAWEKKCEKKTTADDFLKRLKKIIDATLEDNE